MSDRTPAPAAGDGASGEAMIVLAALAVVAVIALVARFCDVH